MKKPAHIYSPKSFFVFTSFAQFFQGIRPKRVNVPHAAAFSLSAGLHNGSIPRVRWTVLLLAHKLSKAYRET